MNASHESVPVLPGTAEQRRQDRARRIFLAHNAIERRFGRKLSFTALGALVAKTEGRKDAKGKLQPYTGGNVQRWEQGEKAPGPDAMEAFDLLAGFPIGYTAYSVGREIVEESRAASHSRLELRATQTRPAQRVAEEPVSRPAVRGNPRPTSR